MVMARLLRSHPEQGHDQSAQRHPVFPSAGTASRPRQRREPGVRRV